MTTDSKKTQTVTDYHGTSYSLVKKIGEGGQGMVLTTNHPNLVVKVSNAYTSEMQLKDDLAQIQTVMRLPLRDLKIALPLSLLKFKNRVGYVMELMDGLESLSSQIERIQNNATDTILYRDTGSFGRRLQILKQLAETLAKLHGRGLAFGDLSPNNIFVSQSVEHHQVWLIDADNIHSQEQFNQHSFHTKNYAAPELIRKESGNNTQTDAWSFAVIALQLLANIHPFNNGIAVQDEEPEIAEEKSERGEFPWIFDTEDDSNEWSGVGFPIIRMLNQRLFKLFQRCFGESRTAGSIYTRPTMGEWHYELHRATRLLLKCQTEDCHSSFIAINNDLICPFCNQPHLPEQHTRFSLWFYHTDDLAQDNPWTSCSEQFFLSLGEEQKIYHEPYSYFDMDALKPWCTLKLTEEGLQITPEHGETVIMQNKEGSTKANFTKSKLLKAEQKGHKDLLLSHPSLQTTENQPFAFFWRFTW